ncbi:MAG: Xaa-Pro peptidase family protein [Nitrososphaerota archaeon]|jgi:Xaa-Pro dipeptidase|nr:Xaa-Pro peptidase family protein [Nitrososphaerota archaeon]
MRIDRLKQAAIKQNKPDVFVIFNPVNIFYFTGFQGAAALLISEQGENVLFVGTLNYEQAKAEVKNVQVQLLKQGENMMDKIVQQASAKKLAIDTLSIDSWRVLAKTIGSEDKLEPNNQIIRCLRAVKDEEEIKRIQEACRIADEGIKAAAQTIRTGITERQVAAEAEYAMRRAGSDGVAFGTITACGASCAYPHGGTGERIISEGDFVIVDLGAMYRLYRSDITRTFIVGKPSQRQLKMYETVKLAQQKAFENIKAHALAKEADLAARRVIEDAGMGKFFVHNLGHGVGLEIHEAPVLSPQSLDLLEPGNVVTDEPGIYVPGYGGVRIEDTVLVTKNGPEKLTKAPYAH